MGGPGRARAGDGDGLPRAAMALRWIALVLRAAALAQRRRARAGRRGLRGHLAGAGVDLGAERGATRGRRSSCGACVRAHTVEAGRARAGGGGRRRGARRAAAGDRRRAIPDL